MNITYRLVLDLQHQSKRNIIEVTQKDYDSHIVQMILLDNGAPLGMADVAAAQIKGVMDGGETVIYAEGIFSTDKNVVSYTIGKTVLDTAGRYTFVLELLGTNSEVLSSFEFYVVVHGTLYDVDGYVSASDLSGFRAYMARTQAAARQTESTKQQFEETYGTLEEVVEELEETSEEYAAVLEDFEQKIASGYFTGPRGPAGEDGKDAISAPADGIFVFQMDGCDLVLYYEGDDAPGLAISGTDLIWTWED